MFRKSSFCSAGGCVEVDTMDWRVASRCPNANCVEVGWHTSSYSGGWGACVEVNLHRVAVRDSKDRGGTVLTTPAAQWMRLIEDIRSGQF